MLKKNSGRCQNQELALDLSCSDQKNGHSSETVGILNVRLDGLAVDLLSLPAARCLTNLQSQIFTISIFARFAFLSLYFKKDNGFSNWMNQKPPLQPTCDVSAHFEPGLFRAIDESASRLLQEPQCSWRSRGKDKSFSSWAAACPKAAFYQQQVDVQPGSGGHPASPLLPCSPSPATSPCCLLLPRIPHRGRRPAKAHHLAPHIREHKAEPGQWHSRCGSTCRWCNQWWWTSCTCSRSCACWGASSSGLGDAVRPIRSSVLRWPQHPVDHLGEAAAPSHRVGDEERPEGSGLLRRPQHSANHLAETKHW